MGEHFCLKWNNHQENLTGIMTKLLDEQKFVDVSLVCEMKTFKAHQTVLSACSPYFQHILEENPHPHPIVILRDVKECEMTALLQYMYRGEVNVRDHELSTFLHTARALQIRGLSDNNNKKETVVQKEELPHSVSPCSPTPTPTSIKRRRLSGCSDTPSNERHVLECQQISPTPTICKANQSQKPSSSVSTSSFSDNMSDVHPYTEIPTPSSGPPIKQEVDGLSSRNDGPFHALAHSMGGNVNCNYRGNDNNTGNGGNSNQREWSVEFGSDNRSYHSQKVELPKVPLPLTQSFSSQLQAPPVPELYPCGGKNKARRDQSSQHQMMQQRVKEQPGPSHNQLHQPVSVIRNAEAGGENIVQRKSGRFRPGWMENFAWLQYDEGLNSMFCKTCRKWSSTVPDIRTSFVEGNANFRLEIVNHHDKSKAHRMCMAKEEESIPRLDPIVCDGMR